MGELFFGFEQKSSLLLIFFCHGILFTLLALKNAAKHSLPSSKWLGWLVLLCTLYFTPHMLGYAGWYSRRFTREILFFIPFMQVLLIGPVVYFYVRSLLSADFKLSRKDWIHLVPSALYLAYSLIVFVTDKLVLGEFYFYADGRDKDLSTWYQATGLISMIFYLVLSLKLYFNYRKNAFETLSYAESVLFQWIRNFMLAFLGLLGLRILFFLLHPEWGSFGSQFWYYLSFAAIMVYIAVSGYIHAERQTVLGNSLVIEQPEEKTDEEVQSKVQQTPPDLKPWKQKLDNVIVEKQLFRNPRLTLSGVAQELDTTSKMVSSIVNSGHDKNFNDYINSYRVEAVITSLKNGDLATMSMLGIALEAGFNSKATFNRAFKKQTGKTPMNYVESLN